MAGKELPTPGTRRAGGLQSGSPPTTINNNNIVININKNYNATTNANMRKQLKQVREEIFDEEDPTVNHPHPAVEEEEEEEGNEDEVEAKSAVHGRVGKQSRMSKKSTGHNLNQVNSPNGAAPYEMTPLRKDQVMMKKWN
jgi:hypothetical protein